jgi:hypothetical protein
MTNFQPQGIGTTPFVPPRSLLDTPEARETGEDYIKVATRLATGPEKNLLEKWESAGRPWTLGGFLEDTIPSDEMDEFREAERKQVALMRASIREAVAAAIEISKRPTCYFDFNMAMIGPSRRGLRDDWIVEGYPLYSNLKSLQDHLLYAPQISRRLSEMVNEAASTEIEQYTPFERAMAALQMSVHLSAGQPSAIWLDQMDQERAILQWISAWAAQDGRAREELESALEQLNQHFRLLRTPLGPLAADHWLVHDVLTGRQPPLVLNQKSDSRAIELAVMANELTWERERALVALEAITRQNLGDAGQLVGVLTGTYGRELANTLLGKWLRPRGIQYGAWPENWVLAFPAAATSYLTRFEYAARTPVHELYRAFCDGEACRRATQLRLALAIYRLDHGEYPTWLSELVPEYLKSLPFDPYLGQPFQYAAEGLDRPLIWRSNNGMFQEIPGSTPLVWSVGPGNARLIKQERSVIQPRFDDPAEAENENSDLVYTLAPEREGWWSEPTLVFPLSNQD